MAARIVSFVVAVGTGAGTVVQAGVNSFLAQHLNAGLLAEDVEPRCSQGTSSVLLASLVSFSGGVVMLFVLISINVAMRLSAKERIKLGWPKTVLELCGGLLGSMNLTSRLFALPVIGFAISSVMMSVGSMVASLLQDHIGLFGAPIVRITRYRVIGALLLVNGAILSVLFELLKDVESLATAPITSLLFALVPLAAGYIGTLQAAINFKLSRNVGMPLIATLISFTVAALFVGTAVMTCGPPAQAGATLSTLPVWAFRLLPRPNPRRMQPEHLA